MTDDLFEERAALADVFARADALSILEDDGWFEALPEPGGNWDTIGVATAAAELGAASAHPVSVGAQYAAGAALATAGGDASGRLDVVTDARRTGDHLDGRLWGSPDAERAVVLLPDGTLGWTDASSGVVDDDPLVWLAGASVRRIRVPLDAIHPLGDSAHAELHAGRVAHFLAAEAVAVAEHATARTLEHLRTREQFGGPIGAQQVLQHRIVDMHLRTLSARTSLDDSTRAWAAGDGSADAWRAKLLAGHHGVWVLENAIQLHGGIGFTEELGLGRGLAIVQRARALLGGVDATARVVAAALTGRPADAPIDRALAFDPRH